MNHTSTNIKIAIIATVLSFLLAELSLRLFNLIIEADTEKNRLRYFWSDNYLISSSNNAIIAKPNWNIRERATCNGDIEFDVSFETNNLGFIDSDDYPGEGKFERYVGLVGDSYTAGTGAGPWIPYLRDKINSNGNDIQLYNFGFVAAGVEQFVRLLEEYAPRLPISDLVILVISDDFERKPWRPLSDDKGIWLCEESLSEKSCMSRKPYIGLVDFNFDNRRLSKHVVREAKKNQLKKTIERSAVHSKDSSESNLFLRIASFVMRKSKVLGLVNRFRHKFLIESSGRLNKKPSEVFISNLRSLERLITILKVEDIRVVQFPSKNEVYAGKYDVALSEYIKDIGIPYTNLWKECSFSLDMFHDCDHHFTKKGYRQFADCIEKSVILPMLLDKQ